VTVRNLSATRVQDQLPPAKGAASRRVQDKLPARQGSGQPPSPGPTASPPEILEGRRRVTSRSRVTRGAELAAEKPPGAARRDGCANPSSKRLAVCVSMPAIRQAPRIRGGRSLASAASFGVALTCQRTRRGSAAARLARDAGSPAGRTRAGRTR